MPPRNKYAPTHASRSCASQPAKSEVARSGGRKWRGRTIAGIPRAWRRVIGAQAGRRFEGIAVGARYVDRHPNLGDSKLRVQIRLRDLLKARNAERAAWLLPIAHLVRQKARQALRSLRQLVEGPLKGRQIVLRERQRQISLCSCKIEIKKMKGTCRLWHELNT